MATNLGCFTHCEEIDFAIDALETGTYTFKVRFNNRVIVEEIDFTIGEDIKITPSFLNEDYGYCMEVFDPDSNSLGEFEFKINVQI